MRDVENGLRALLREAGLKLGTPARKELAVRVRELTAADPVLSALAEPLLTIIAAMTRELAQLTKRVPDDARAVAPHDARPPHGAGRAGLPPADGRARRRPADRALVPRHHRPTRPLPRLARRRRAPRPHTQALPVRRDRRAGRDQPLR